MAGHHHFEVLKRLKHKTIPVKYANEDYPTEADAIRYAKEISNANRTLEEPYERAAIYRKYREEGYPEKDINEKAALEGKKPLLYTQFIVPQSQRSNDEHPRTIQPNTKQRR